MKKIMKTVKYAILPAILLCLFLTGCGGIKAKDREEILSCLTRKGYIGKEDVLEYEEKCMNSELLAYVKYYDYIYCDENEKLYNIRIYPSHSEEKEEYDIEIYYDIEVEEVITKSGDSEYVHINMSDYANKQELTVERKNWFIFSWLAVTED